MMEIQKNNPCKLGGAVSISGLMQSFLVPPPLYFCNCFSFFGCWLLSLTTCCYLFSKDFFFQVNGCSEIAGVSSAGNCLQCLWTIRASLHFLPTLLILLLLDLALLGVHPLALFAPCIMRVIIMFDHFNCPWFFFLVRWWNIELSNIGVLYLHHVAFKIATIP